MNKIPVMSITTSKKDCQKPKIKKHHCCFKNSDDRLEMSLIKKRDSMT